MHLFLGGEKSGKSALAMQAMLQAPGPGCLLATGRPLDAGFREQVRKHRLERPAALPVIETGLDLHEAIADALGQGARSILADSLDFWLFSCLDSGKEILAQDFAQQMQTLREQQTGGEFWLGFVSCEIGLGPVAATAFTRRFVRELGSLHQELAKVCDTVCLAVAGLPLYVKKGHNGILPQA